MVTTTPPAMERVRRLMRYDGRQTSGRAIDRKTSRNDDIRDSWCGVAEQHRVAALHRPSIRADTTVRGPSTWPDTVMRTSRLTPWPAGMSHSTRPC